MALVNSNIPLIQAFVRKEFLYNLEKGKGEFVPCIIFGVASLQNRALGFHCMMDNGAVFWRLPLHAFTASHKAPSISIEDAQFWDNISQDITVTSYDFLKLRDATIKLRSGSIKNGTYLFTIDYISGFYAESAHEHKCSHIFQLEDGNFTSQPNNRIIWKDASFVVDTKLPDYLRNTHIWTSENNMITENSERFFYEVDKNA